MWAVWHLSCYKGTVKGRCCIVLVYSMRVVVIVSDRVGWIHAFFTPASDPTTWLSQQIRDQKINFVEPKSIELLPCDWLIRYLHYWAAEQVYLTKWPVSVRTIFSRLLMTRVLEGLSARMWSLPKISCFHLSSSLCLVLSYILFFFFIFDVRL